MEEIVEKLNRHRSESASRWREKAAFRMENKDWLRYSQSIAMMTLDAMEKESLTQKALAEKMGCSQQYVSKILKGQENMSLETISKLERALDLDILSGTLSVVCGYEARPKSSNVYLSDSSSLDYGK